MNKTLSISLVTALGLVGGGSYLLLKSDKNLSHYVPESITSLAADYLPDSFKAKTPDVIEGVSEVIEYQTTPEVEVQIQQEVVEQAATQQQIEQPGVQLTETVIEEENEQNSLQNSLENPLAQSDESVVDIAMQEIQNSLNETSNPQEVINNIPDVKIIESEIVAASTEISKIDMENKQLKEEFQNILRENRALAKQLQEINKQLAHTK